MTREVVVAVGGGIDIHRAQSRSITSIWTPGRRCAAGSPRRIGNTAQAVAALHGASQAAFALEGCTGAATPRWRSCAGRDHRARRRTGTICRARPKRRAKHADRSDAKLPRDRRRRGDRSRGYPTGPALEAGAWSGSTRTCWMSARWPAGGRNRRNCSRWAPWSWRWARRRSLVSEAHHRRARRGHPHRGRHRTRQVDRLTGGHDPGARPDGLDRAPPTGLSRVGGRALTGSGATATSVIIRRQMGDTRRFHSSDDAVRHAGLDVTVYSSDGRRNAGHLAGRDR